MTKGSFSSRSCCLPLPCLSLFLFLLLPLWSSCTKRVAAVTVKPAEVTVPQEVGNNIRVEVFVLGKGNDSIRMNLESKLVGDVSPFKIAPGKADILVKVNVTQSDARTQRWSEQVEVTHYEKVGDKQVERKRTETWHYQRVSGSSTAELQLINLKNGEILHGDTITRSSEGKKERTGTGEALTTEEQVRGWLLTAVLNTIAEKVVPHRVQQMVDLETGKGLERGMVYAQNGQWDEAIRAWKEAEMNPAPVQGSRSLESLLGSGDSTASLHYNLGVAYMMKGGIDSLTEAIAEFKKAIEIKPKDRYAKALSQADGLMRDHIKLQEQTSARGQKRPAEQSGSEKPAPAQSAGSSSKGLEPGSNSVVVTESSANVRSGPGTKFKKVGTAKKGEKFAVLERSKERYRDKPWYKIRLENGNEGWVWSGSVKEE